jgi:hypothetical protein
VRGATSAITAGITETGAIKETLLRSSAPAALRDEAQRIELELKALQESIGGNARRDLYGDPGPVSINNRIQPALMGNFRSTYGPTPTHIASLEIAESMFTDVKVRLEKALESDLPALREQLDAAGVPWTPGRVVPAKD